jgi:hypothetical protein
MTQVELMTTRLDELASSLHRAGLTGDAAARLLELSALATMKAVELELRVAARNEPPALSAAATAELAAPLQAAA